MIIRTFKIATLCAILFLAYIGGIASNQLEVGLSGQVNSLINLVYARFEGGHALTPATTKSQTARKLLSQAVITNNIDQKFYVLLNIRYHNTVQLINQNGTVMHEWSLPFSKAFPKPSHIPKMLPDSNIHLRGALAQADGSVIATFEAVGATPYGYGLVKVDQFSNVIWSVAENIHHEIHIDDAGNILALAHQLRSKVNNEDKLLPIPFLDDHILIISSDGKVEKRLSLYDAFSSSPFNDWMYKYTRYKSRFNVNWDIFHANSIIPIKSDNLYFSQFGKNLVMVSIRNLDALAVIDLNNGKVVHVVTGPWQAQHSISILDNGNISLFDNRGFINQNRYMRSRVLELTPSNGEIVWSTGQKSPPHLMSFAYGQVKPIEDGFLITDSLQSAIYYVTRDKIIQWSLKLPRFYLPYDKSAPPFNGEKVIGKMIDLYKPNIYLDDVAPDYNLATAIMSATRYMPEELPFLKHPY